MATTYISFTPGQTEPTTWTVHDDFTIALGDNAFQKFVDDINTPRGDNVINLNLRRLMRRKSPWE